MNPPSPRRVIVPRTLTLIGLAAMIVLAGFGFAGFTYESGDRAYFAFFAEAVVGAVTAVCAVWWIVWAPRKAVAITVLVLSIVINPIWIFLLIRMLG